MIDDSTGDPVMYVVASGDNLSSIADRLGITVDELTTTSGAYAGIVPGQRLALRP
ncbi:LysM peptidoglycan-binding domain-containing protein [Humibacter sp.]|uniref:LysM peptidoglycan-binding domain-containing protein n=1 Tax=Humibacter sp. TaxID=1940291 RepID=UPI003F7E03AB